MINFSNADGEVIKRKRSCTDVPCLLIFGAFLAAWTGIAVIAVSNGDINKWVLGATYNYINSLALLHTSSNKQTSYRALLLKIQMGTYYVF